MSEEKLILASKSPRRRELMEKLGIPFVAEPSDAEEMVPPTVPIEKTAEYLSRIKADEIYKHHQGKGYRVIGSDTVVVCDGRIFGKPKDREDAAEMLRTLSGKTHKVLTGVTILGDDIDESFTSETKVTFYELSEEEIQEYLDTGEPFDKAGAYGIQGYGALLVEKIEGDYYTVVGFPIAEVRHKIRK